MSRLHSSPWAIRYRHLSLDLISDEDSLHPRVGIHGYPLELESAREAPDLGPVRELLATLPARNLHLMVALYWEGKSARQVAREWGVDRRSIDRRRNRTLNKLREALKDGRQVHRGQEAGGEGPPVSSPLQPANMEAPAHA